MYKETAVRLVPKEHLQILKDENGFVRHIVHGISTDLAERLISILNAEGEIIVRQSDLRVEKQKILNLVEYKKNIMWTPLIRCRDCVLQRMCVPGQYLGDDGYCSKGERREESEQ